jgi:hypothetical protein
MIKIEGLPYGADVPTDAWLRPDAMSRCPVYSLISKSLALLAPILTLLNFV